MVVAMSDEHDPLTCDFCHTEGYRAEYAALRAQHEQVREAARQLLGAHQGGEDIVPYLNALEDAAGFWQQGQER